MSNTESVSELLKDPRFKAATDGIFAAVVEGLRENGRMASANMAIDALAYVQAVFLEAHPGAAGMGGLRKQGKLAGEDLMAFLKVARTHYEQTGKHLLETIGTKG